MKTHTMPKPNSLTNLQRATRVLKALENHYRLELDGVSEVNRPKLIPLSNLSGRDSDEARYAIVWEGFIYDWPMEFCDADYKNDYAISHYSDAFLECYTSYALAVYPPYVK
jgi:hypothetical protein